MIDIESLLNTDPQIEVYGARPSPHWKLGALCRYTSSYGSEDYGCSARLKVHLTWYETVKITSKGRWISVGWSGGPRKFVLDDARRKFAYPTEELAADSFRQRKQWHVRRLRFDLEHAEAALKFMEEKCNSALTSN